MLEPALPTILPPLTPVREFPGLVVGLVPIRQFVFTVSELPWQTVIAPGPEAGITVVPNTTLVPTAVRLALFGAGLMVTLTVEVEVLTQPVATLRQKIVSVPERTAPPKPAVEIVYVFVLVNPPLLVSAVEPVTTAVTVLGLVPQPVGIVRIPDVVSQATTVLLATGFTGSEFTVTVRLVTAELEQPKLFVQLAVYTNVPVVVVGIVKVLIPV